jgi:response regulator NasT
LQIGGVGINIREMTPRILLVDTDTDRVEAWRNAFQRPGSWMCAEVMFSDRGDPAFVNEAIAAGVCSYNLSGIASQEVKPIIAIRDRAF